MRHFRFLEAQLIPETSCIRVGTILFCLAICCYRTGLYVLTQLRNQGIPVSRKDDPEGGAVPFQALNFDPPPVILHNPITD